MRSCNPASISTLHPAPCIAEYPVHPQPTSLHLLPHTYLHSGWEQYMFPLPHSFTLPPTDTKLALMASILFPRLPAAFLSTPLGQQQPLSHVPLPPLSAPCASGMRPCSRGGHCWCSVWLLRTTTASTHRVRGLWRTWWTCLAHTSRWVCFRAAGVSVRCVWVCNGHVIGCRMCACLSARCVHGGVQDVCAYVWVSDMCTPLCLFGCRVGRVAWPPKTSKRLCAVTLVSGLISATCHDGAQGCGCAAAQMTVGLQNSP